MRMINTQERVCKTCGKEFKTDEAPRKQCYYCLPIPEFRDKPAVFRKTCRVCGGEFTTPHPRKVYCSYKCADAVTFPLAGYLTPLRREYFLEKFSHTCQECGCTIMEAKSLDIHHILPLSSGGGNAEANLTLLCSSCHGMRHHLHNKPLAEDIGTSRQGLYNKIANCTWTVADVYKVAKALDIDPKELI